MKSGLEWSERLVRAAGFNKPSPQSRADISTLRRPRHAGTACKVPNASGMLALWLLGGHVPILRADFDVKASLVLPDNSPPLTLRHRDGHYEIVLRNGPKDSDGHTPRLDVSVIGPCEDFDSAGQALSDVLAKQLDMLAYVTHSKFEIYQCRRVVDWEPFQRSRRYTVMKKFDSDYPPDPELNADLVETANALTVATPPHYVLRALHFFRMGMLNRQRTDQFQQFWLAIETIAEGSKEPGRVAILCQKCDGPLSCEACRAEQMRRPMASEAIQQLLKAGLGEGADACFRRLKNTRDHIFHGRSAHSIEKDLDRSLDDLVNESASVAWQAIQSKIPTVDREKPLTFGHRGGNFITNDIIVGPQLLIENDGQSEHPADDALFDVGITLRTRFGPPPPDANTE
jgi:hypothetical protein